MKVISLVDPGVNPIAPLAVIAPIPVISPVVPISQSDELIAIVSSSPLPMTMAPLSPSILSRVTTPALVILPSDRSSASVARSIVPKSQIVTPVPVPTVI